MTLRSKHRKARPTVTQLPSRMLIQTKAIERIGIGRFGITINDFEKVVYIDLLRGQAPSPHERGNLEKLIHIKRPDIFGPEGVLTGWAIQFPLDFNAGRATLRPTV